MRHIAAVLLIVVVAVFPSSAQWRDNKTGEPIADSEWQKSVDGLGAALVITDDADAFLKEWTSTPESHAPVVKPVTKVKRGAVITALIVFGGCSDGKGHCDALVDYRVLNPDGSVYGDIPGNSAWLGASPKPGIIVISSWSVLGFCSAACAAIRNSIVIEAMTILMRSNAALSG